MLVSHVRSLLFFFFPVHRSVWVLLLARSLVTAALRFSPFSVLLSLFFFPFVRRSFLNAVNPLRFLFPSVIRTPFTVFLSSFLKSSTLSCFFPTFHILGTVAPCSCACTCDNCPLHFYLSLSNFGLVQSVVRTAAAYFFTSLF